MLETIVTIKDRINRRDFISLIELILRFFIFSKSIQIYFDCLKLSAKNNTLEQMTRVIF